MTIAKIRCGDIVEINNIRFWVCSCKEAPLNRTKNKKCAWCNCVRPGEDDFCPVCKGFGSAVIEGKYYPYCPTCKGDGTP